MCVQNLVMIAPPYFSPEMGENATQILPSLPYPFLSFPFLSYFILAHLYSLNAWIDFYAWYLKMSGSAQGSAFCMIRPFKTNIWGR